jgi:hypothetical protein
MKLPLVMFAFFTALSAEAAFFQWKHRAFSREEGKMPVYIVKDGPMSRAVVDIPNAGATYSAAEWRCVVEEDKKITPSTFGTWFMESRRLECTHSSGAKEVQIATCQFDKAMKVTISDSAEVNLSYKNESLYVQIACDL